MPLTPAQARELWASELESGKWKQGTEYCCLGVACELAVREGIIESYCGVDGCLDDPYSAVREWPGLANGEGAYDDYTVSLVSRNDAGVPFKQIAATIRNELEGLIA